ncbi:glycoside hydrolase family 79 protein [Piedraia hortae CBS 480.64]|uniref:Glycoside hydrolase family 79 protein n=1 Tax=Piedraia hortae CBS 480.64 TaxID=1314780 RepID=A0A6A7BSY0_9PEZI|nr:glycoside hydrolase family 79 protein [Piedraia hortae CBS 480.64]
MRFSSLLASIAIGVCHVATAQSRPDVKVFVSSSAPGNAGIPLESFLSYSIEFAFWPDYAGNVTHPNTFTNQLLENMASYAGSKPFIRVGGTSQDNAVFDKTLKVATLQRYNLSISRDQPVNLKFGPSFFDSYRAITGTRYTHGFNLGRNTTAERHALLDSVAYACRTLRSDLDVWELGNEPDFYGFPLQGAPIRPSTYHEAQYVQEWRFWVEKIREEMRKSCSDLAGGAKFKLMGPSGLNADKVLGVITRHNYVGYASRPGNTLAGTLLNHSVSVEAVASLSEIRNELNTLPNRTNIPFIIGEGNSLAGQGQARLSDTFGSALWGIDFSLLLAANNISRFHMHQGTNYRYQSWQPVETNRTTMGTKPPYYGNIAVAAFLGNLTRAEGRPKVVNIPLNDSIHLAAYAAYVNGQLGRIMLINLNEFNATEGNDFITPGPRPSQRFTIPVNRLRYSPVNFGASVKRLMANGSDAMTGITFDGYSYDYELEKGKPVLSHDITRGERVAVQPITPGNGNGIGMAYGIEVDVPDSSAAILSF